jgi:hypothetical protein
MRAFAKGRRLATRARRGGIKVPPDSSDCKRALFSSFAPFTFARTRRFLIAARVLTGQ